MIPRPTKLFLVAGKGEATIKLNAFDKALLSAGIGNVNLIKVSSIVPPNIELIEPIAIPPGSLVPVAYGSISSDQKGEIISAAVAVGLGKKEDYGVIMEFSGRCKAQEAKAQVIEMTEQAFAYRNRDLETVEIAVVEHRVERVGAVIAAAVLTY